MAPRASLALAFVLSGCFPSGEGVDPPTDRTVYFPVGLALDQDASHLFISNSDFDLQYNAGTVESWDLVALRDLLPRSCASDADCNADSEVCDTSSERGRVPSHWCVTKGPASSDGSDTEHAQAGPACGKIGELSPAERQLYPGRCRWLAPQRGFANPYHPDHGKVHRATVQIGAFATDAVYRARPAGAPASTWTGRLFVPVRGDATLHFIETSADGNLDCGQSEPGGACDEGHRRGNNPASENTRNDSLLPEPFGIDADQAATFVMLTNQTSSALGLFQNVWGAGSGFDNGPTYQFTTPVNDGQPMGLAAVPAPWVDIAQGLAPAPNFIASFRSAAVLELLRVYPDADSTPPRPYAKVVESVRVLANANGADSRGMAIDSSERRAAEERCAARYGIDAACAEDPACAAAAGPDYLACVNDAADIPLDVLVANRAPASLLVGETQRATPEQPGPLDIPAIQQAIALGYGPARVVVGNITNSQGERERRAFAVCFDSRRVVIYDTARQRIDHEIQTGRGPQAFIVDEEHALGFVAHFTDSYIGVVDLDERHPLTYGAIIGSVEEPVAPEVLEMKARAARVVAGLALAVVASAFSCVLDGCNQQSIDAKLRSLQASSEVTFVCRTIDSGVPRDQCPDRDNAVSTTVLDALVTQTATNEIAIVDSSHAVVVDVDMSVPGYNFLRLPSRPGDIVTTPGGTASFVGLTTSGKTGISALPTNCLGPPRAADIAEGIRQSQRDVTTFPACSLPSLPGDMAVVVEPPAADGTVAAACADPNTPEDRNPPGGTRYAVVDAVDADACYAQLGPAGQHGVWVETPGSHECRLPNGRDCASNLTAELGPPGRRKLVVALPDEGKLVVLDAQKILDREPGSFAPCEIERELVLESAEDAGGATQKPPADLQPSAECKKAALTPPAAEAGTHSRPSGLAVADDGRIFVGDQGVPLVHVVDGSSVCGLHELPALLPMSYSQPKRVVTTSRVAVTPLTPAGKQYVYAVDTNDQPTSSVMIFDVSEAATDRTPLVRSGSARQPREQPDRLQYAAPVGDITFALRDLPASDPNTGVAELGTQCDPDPSASVDPPTAGVQYRTSADRTQGARPHLLRGLFGLVLLTNGQLYVVDVDDFDRPCRRALGANPLSSPDFRGCANDPDIGYYNYVRGEDGSISAVGVEEGGTPSVSNEVSCNMVEPHRTRSAAFGIADPTLGVGAPSLRALPHFQPPTYLPSQKATERPKLLAVNFESPDGGEGVEPEVYIGTTLYKPSSDAAKLATVPSTTQDTNALALPPAEPRSYLTSDKNALTYEGRVVGGDYPSGFFDLSGLGPDTNGVVNDATAFYCGNGIYDEAEVADYARTILGLSEKAATAFAQGSDLDPAQGHADYVQITGDFPSIIDPYWQSSRGLTGGGREQCLEAFGPPPGQGQDLQTSRDFRIIEAYQDHLVIRPRNPPRVTANPGAYPEGSPERDEEQKLYDEQVAARDGYPDKIKQAVAYCFPSGVRYTVRGGNQWIVSNGTPNWLHDTIVDHAAGDRCVRDCDPRKRWFKNRVFEIATTDRCGPEQTPEACATAAGVGPGTSADGPCRYDPVIADPNAGGALTARGIGLHEPNNASNCIFENLTSRFALYRGIQPSARDMSFVWEQVGGFYALYGSLTTQSVVILPQHLSYVSEYQSIAIVDGATLGLSFMSLDSLIVSDPWPVY